jgi:hypothetical protein
VGEVVQLQSKRSRIVFCSVGNVQNTGLNRIMRVIRDIDM